MLIKLSVYSCSPKLEEYNYFSHFFVHLASEIKEISTFLFIIFYVAWIFYVYYFYKKQWSIFGDEAIHE